MINAADLFCGAGGTSTGLLLAAAELGLDVNLLAVNHWNLAIDTHTRNHPGVRHLCESLDHVDPHKVCPGRLHLLLASPECTHHSIARGGKPRSDQSRASAWKVVDWAAAKQPDDVMIENVKEFTSWGPLTKKGKPDKRYVGRTFKAFIGAMESLGYKVEWRIQNAANFGDATTRHRFIMIARRNGKPPWPAHTHAGKWKPAKDVIDWSIEGQSIYARKKPLSANTMKRIEAGLRKFGGEAFTVQIDHTSGIGVPRSVSEPMGTVVTKENTALVKPFLMHVTHHGSDRVHSVDSPMPCVTGAHRGELALVKPFIVNLRGTQEAQLNGSCKSVEEPLPALTTSGAHVALCEPFVIGQQSCAAPRGVDEPLPTVATAGAIALVEPFLVKYHGTGGAYSVRMPIDTISTRDRFGLAQPIVEVEGEKYVLDVRFRMLQPHELSAAMSFPKDYEFAGNREAKVKQIGNAVPVQMAKAHCKQLLLN